VLIPSPPEPRRTQREVALKGRMAEQAIQRSIEAYRTRDLSSANSSPPTLDSTASSARSTNGPRRFSPWSSPCDRPAASILSVIRSTPNLEPRSCDPAVNIAVRVREMAPFPHRPSPSTFPSWPPSASAMVRKHLQPSIRVADADLAKSVLLREDQSRNERRRLLCPHLADQRKAPSLPPRPLNPLISSRTWSASATTPQPRRIRISWVRGGPTFRHTTTHPKPASIRHLISRLPTRPLGTSDNTTPRATSPPPRDPPRIISRA